MGCVSVYYSTLFLAVTVTLNVSKALCLKVSMVTAISTNQGRCFILGLWVEPFLYLFFVVVITSLTSNRFVVPTSYI